MHEHAKAAVARYRTLERQVDLYSSLSAKQRTAAFSWGSGKRGNRRSKALAWYMRKPKQDWAIACEIAAPGDPTDRAAAALAEPIGNGVRCKPSALQGSLRSQALEWYLRKPGQDWEIAKVEASSPSELLRLLDWLLTRTERLTCFRRMRTRMCWRARTSCLTRTMSSVRFFPVE